MTTAKLRAPICHAESLAVGQSVTLDAHHVRALRFREINTKEAFTLVDREGKCFRAALKVLKADSGEAQIYEAMATSPESPAHLTLLCAVLARQRMLGVIQKATELGAMGVIPVLSERSVQQAGLAHEKAHAWPAQALRAARQCRRASIPEVRSAQPFATALDSASFREANHRFYLDDRAAVDSTLPTVCHGACRIAFVVGPEGGFTDEERSALVAKGVSPLRLGGRVLRAETAVLVGLTLLQHLYGDL